MPAVYSTNVPLGSHQYQFEPIVCRPILHV